MVRQITTILAMFVVFTLLGSATVEWGMHGYSSGVYDFSTSVVLQGNAWGNTDSVFMPTGFSAAGEYEGYNCGSGQDFRIDTSQTLSFMKSPSNPEDPYFSDWSMTYGIGEGKDRATVTTSSGLSIVSGWASAGIGTSIEAKDDYVSYGLCATDYQGWTSEGVLEAYSFSPDTLTVSGGASFDPVTSYYPMAGMSWEIT